MQGFAVKFTRTPDKERWGSGLCDPGNERRGERRGVGGLLLAAGNCPQNGSLPWPFPFFPADLAEALIAVGHTMRMPMPRQAAEIWR